MTLRRVHYISRTLLTLLPLAAAPTARLFRDVKLMEIGAGTSEIRRMLVGRELMGAMG